MFLYLWRRFPALTSGNRMNGNVFTETGCENLDSRYNLQNEEQEMI